MRLAIIPARGGSKRIPRKNIKLFHGKPMIAYAIRAALESEMFEKVIVSTDDNEIAEIAQALGAEVPFKRPSELADDFTPTVPVVAHAISACQEIGWDVEEVCCIYPAAPFISVNDIVIAYEMLQKASNLFVFPVANFSSPIQRALLRLNEGITRPFFPEFATTRTQDLQPAYYDVGQFYWGKSSSWLKQSDIHSNCASVVIPEWRVVDIDTPEDWERAEILFTLLSEKKLS